MCFLGVYDLVHEDICMLPNLRAPGPWRHVYLVIFRALIFDYCCPIMISYSLTLNFRASMALREKRENMYCAKMSTFTWLYLVDLAIPFHCCCQFPVINFWISSFVSIYWWDLEGYRPHLFLYILYIAFLYICFLHFRKLSDNELTKLENNGLFKKLVNLVRL